MLSLLYGPTLTLIHDYWKNHSFDYTDQNDTLFIIRDWNAKVGSQEIPGVTGKFGLGVQNEAGQRLSSAKRMHSSQQIPFLNSTKDELTHGHHQMVNTEIKLITFLVAKDGKAVCSQKK